MKWYHVALIFTLILSVVFGTLYFTHRRVEYVEKPVSAPEIVYAKPDTVYIIKYVKKVIGVPVEAVINLDTASVAQDTTVSEVTLNHLTLLGPCDNFIQVKSFGDVFSIGARPSFPQASEAMDNIRREIAEQVKSSNKFWFGFSTGVAVVSALTITTLYLTR